ncbi:hypothetical protein SRS16CHR_01480 [Variovorax sp. SRS16]|uniref:hypothetical protein n=1 Tax=Variovorax sp. SRS16 TaxID=282217 RepID=UPI0013168CCB|nr:hypothetical protein [Variovorax sp. SRS16]VTU15433.1 hypothetical protein SRS16CHR_01480 [Variovorax sp. SRS16]
MSANDNILVASLMLFAALNLAGHHGGERAYEREPAPQEVTEMIDEALTFPAAGDDLTMYISGRFTERDGRIVQLPASAAPATPVL